MAEPRDEADLLRVYLAGRDVPCPQCKYNLRDLIGANCPECGEAVQLRVSAVDPRQAAPLAGLVVLSAGAGLNALLLIYALIEFGGRGGGRGLGKFVVINLVEVGVMGVCVAVWLWSWRAIRRLGVVRRWMLVAACAAITLADVIFFAKLLR